MSKPYGKPNRVVIALGGNALGNTREVQQLDVVRTYTDDIREFSIALTMNYLYSIHCRLLRKWEGIRGLPFDLREPTCRGCPCRPFLRAPWGETAVTPLRRLE